MSTPPTPKPVPLNMAEAEAFAEDERPSELDDEGRAHVHEAIDSRLAKGGLDVPPGGEP